MIADRSSGGVPARPRHWPTVSVITPVRDLAQVLPRAVRSVQAQDFGDWEMIVADDASRDGSAAAAERLAGDDARLRVLRLPRHGGAARARNAAMAVARGRYVAFLDADDEWLPGKLTRQLDFIRRRGAALSYTGFERMVRGRARRIHVPDRVDHDTLMRGNVIGCLTAIYDRRKLGLVEMPDVWRRQDLGLWLTILQRTQHAHGLDEVLARHHCRAGSLSANRLAAAMWTYRVYRRIGGLAPPAAVYCLGQHLGRRLLRG